MHEILEAMLTDMETAGELYKPTHFWKTGLPSIIADFNRNGLDSFRSHTSAARFYVPLYAPVWYWKYRRPLRLAGAVLDKIKRRRIYGTRLMNLLSGRDQAEIDYRLFLASDSKTPPQLVNLSESEIGRPREQFFFEGKRYSRSFLNYLRGINFLKKCVTTERLKTILEIGGGYGSLGEILLKSDPEAFYVNVDIPPLAVVSTYYLTELLGREQVLSYDCARNMDSIDVAEMKKKYRCAILCPWQLEKLRGEFDLFANFMSFQEMEPGVVLNYARIVQKLTREFVLLRSSVRGKRGAASGKTGVLEPLTTDEIIGMFNEFSLVERDSQAFGFVSPRRHRRRAPFRSEVICLRRTKPAAPWADPLSSSGGHKRRPAPYPRALIL